MVGMSPTALGTGVVAETGTWREGPGNSHAKRTVAFDAA
jgi:hypothetical protein